MKKLDFISSFAFHNNQYLTWKKYAKNIYGIHKSQLSNKDIKTIICSPINAYNKETYSIKSIIDETKKITNKFILLNSDIEIDKNDIFWEKILSTPDDSLVIGNRFNYSDNYSDATINLNGIDFFLINQNLQIPDDHTFCIGLCCWDWWLPYLAIKQKISLFKINQPFIYHKNHAKNWTRHSCRSMNKYFTEITGYLDIEKLKTEILSYCEEIN
jgi:hypothetical protein